MINTISDLFRALDEAGLIDYQEVIENVLDDFEYYSKQGQLNMLQVIQLTDQKFLDRCFPAGMQKINKLASECQLQDT